MRARVSHVKVGVGKRTRENNNKGEKIRRYVNRSKFGFWVKILPFKKGGVAGFCREISPLWV